MTPEQAAQQQIGDGLKVRSIDATAAGRQIVCASPYEYAFYRCNGGEEIAITHLNSWTLYLLSKDPATNIRVPNSEERMEEGDLLQVEGQGTVIKADGGRAHFFAVGVRDRHPATTGMVLVRAAQLYKVTKPWGHELWLNGQHPLYAFKQIFIKAGFKTSLQYHKFKRETNVLLQGIANLHYLANASLSLDKVTGRDTASLPLKPVCAVDVFPNTVHRLEAVTDILLYESSTPHLDDVIRIQDDTLRPDGRIDQEHPRRQ